MEGEKVFAVKFGKDCPCGKPDCPVRDVLKNLMERVAVQQDLEKQAAEEIKNLNDLVEKEYPDKPPSLINVMTFLRGIEAAREQKKEKENPAEQQPTENQDEPPPLVEYDLHIPSLERVAAVRVRASEREVAKAIFRAAGEGANELKIKTKYVDASVRIKLKEEGYIVRDDGDYWVEIRW